ncbi:hypothetical protein [Acidicapsa ligni]|uniref:hypothetical protein n=1 Tax=Acidicapsa ligni TaxID=542300 RepID=UPI0021DFF519|nr:hypothetical protein [Acidicapsa ligni]
MPNNKIRSRTLYHHFFRRFFDNDTLSLEAETETTVIRALCTCAVPALMVAFWLFAHYANRPVWAVAADRYFFVLYSFVVMGAVATFQWDMLFPDRADFLILLPMPLKSRDLFYAKGKAVLSFLGMFLVAANLFGLIFFPAASTPRGGSYFHCAWAHLVAVTLAGIFAALVMLAIKGVMLCVLPSRWFGLISPILQSLSITVLLLVLFLYPLLASHMQMLLEGHATFAGFIPPLWFLGLYEQLLYGSSAPAGAYALESIGLYATAAAASLAVLTYPLAWSRQKKRALEGASKARGQSSSVIANLLHRTLLSRPQQRAIFHFISQTITRSTRYQVYLAIYSGVGFALALCSVLTLQVLPNNSTGKLSFALSNSGLHAVLPLLLFWLVTGLRAAYAFPVDMLARWVFPINLPYPGNDAKAAKTWVLLFCGLITSAVFCILLALKWSYLDLALQAIYGTSLSLLLADLFFVGRTQIPFTRPRMPGRTNLPIVFTLYGAVFPLLVIFTVKLEIATETKLHILAWILFGTVTAHVLLKIADYLAQRGIIGGFPEDEGDEGPQTLGLFL